MKFLERIQNLSEGKKKIIIWTVTSLIGVIMFTVWIFSLPGKFEEDMNSGFFDKIVESFENAR